MFIGIDIGGTSIKSGLLNSFGDVILKKEIPINKSDDYEVIESQIINIIKILLDESKKNGENVKSIGIGIPGIADKDSDKVIYCTNLGWRNVPLGINIKKHFKIPVHIDNDATVAAIAENVKGVTKKYDNSIFITLGTGVGGGIIINKKVYSGSHNKGSEIGHMVVGENFYDCNCGNNGCLETFASATALIKYTKKLINEGESTILTKENLNAKVIFDAAKNKDILANMAVDRMVKYLSIGMGNLINLLDPEIIALGGGVSKAGDYLLEKIENNVSKYLVFNEGKTTDIAIAKLSNDAGIIGAGMLQEYI
ncbi:MAG: ROK family protein [Firmicutes bacterium]|nr:ROK family protein [Bacillota bacterium]